MAALLAACASGGAAQATQVVSTGPKVSTPSTDPRSAGGASGRLTVLTYNVAGLPQWLSRSKPRQNLPRIGELMNGYDLVVVQEDFAYPDALRERARFQQQTPGNGGNSVFNLGDGLSRFATHSFESFRRVPWSTCHGHLRRGCDCMAPKGFSVATHRVMPGIVLDVYNVHLDAGKADGDVEARAVQTAQLVRYIRTHSKDRAVLVAGDTNFKTDRDRRHTEKLLRDVGLRDACTALNCSSPRRIDRVFFRSSKQVRITPRKWRMDRRFTTESGENLSDHKAISVSLDVRVRP